MHTRTSKQTCNSTMFLHWFSLMNESILYYIAVLPVQPLTHNRKLINVHSVNYYSNDAIFIHAAADAVKSLQSCPTLCDPIDSSPPGSAVPGILQARILEWVAISLSNACMHAQSLQSCPSLCDPMASSSPGSSVHRILQARLLEWVVISFSHIHVRI